MATTAENVTHYHLAGGSFQALSVVSCSDVERRDTCRLHQRRAACKGPDNKWCPWHGLLRRACRFQKPTPAVPLSSYDA